MDVAYYLSELLGQLGEINVPGLGYFVQLRVDGYYNNEEGKFYPPGSKVDFDPQYLDDDILVQYIADKKKISLASSKYFTEKYITNLRNEAMTKDVPLADLGWMYFEGTKLRFKTSEVLEADPAFYGYPQIEINKLGGTSIFDQIESERSASTTLYNPVTQSPEPELQDEAVAKSEEYFTPQTTYEPEAEVAYTPPVEAYVPPTYTPEPVYSPQPQEEVEEDFIFHGKGYDAVDGDDEYRPRSYAWIWITLLVLIALAAGGIFALYKYKPATFERLRGMIQHAAPAAVKAPAKHDTIKNITPVDTTKKGVIADTTAKAVTASPPATNDTLTKIHYEILGGTFARVGQANGAISNYKKLGIEARILKNVPGKLYKVTLGTFFVKQEAIDAKDKLVKGGKVSEGNLVIQPYYPQINPKK